MPFIFMSFSCTFILYPFPFQMASNTSTSGEIKVSEKSVKEIPPDLMDRFTSALSHLSEFDRNVALTKVLGVSEVDAIKEELMWFIVGTKVVDNRSGIEFTEAYKFMDAFPKLEMFIKKHHQIIAEGCSAEDSSQRDKLLETIAKWRTDEGDGN